MSTQINVAIGGGGLVDRSKEQTQANRWNKAEADARQAALQEGLRQRDGLLQQDGRAPDGGPLYGSATDARSRLDEPVARRSLKEYFFLRPGADFVEYPDVKPWGNGYYPVKSYRHPSRAWTDSGPGWPLFYSSTLGPAGSPALILDPSREEPDASDISSVTLRAEFEEGEIDFGLFNDFTISDFTLQYYAKLDYKAGSPDNAVTRVVILVDGYDEIEVSSNVYRLEGTGPLAASLQCAILRPGQPYVYMGAGGVITEGSVQASIPNQWAHYAVTKKGQTLRAFINGALVQEQQPDSLSTIRVRFAEVDITMTSESPAVFPAERVYLHGVKFEHRAVYTAPFTPPPFIT